MRMRRLFLTVGLVLLLGLPSQAQEEPQKPHPLLEKLSHRIGEWEADITMFGIKIGSTRWKWRWAAGGNVLLCEVRSQSPTFNFDDTGLQVVTVDDDSIVLRSYSSNRDKDGTPAQSEPATISNN